MPQDRIVIHGARQHNLKNIDLELPRNQLVVITGLSGSGKSSLAFDTIYAEGQRRYVESLSAYARQFLGQMDKPDVDYIDGLSPAISIDQKGVSNNPRSTVGTVTEIYDYLRLLYARIGQPHCPSCGRAITRQTVQQIVDAVLAIPAGSRMMIMAPLIKDRKGEHQTVFEEMRRSGFVRVRVDGEVRDLSDDIALDKKRKHSIEVVVDRLVAPQQGNGEGSGDTNRITDSVETALKLGNGVVLVAILNDEEIMFSEHFACVHCGISFGELAPRSFSFNSPHGACPTCSGLGTTLEIDPHLIVPDDSLSLAEGALHPWSKSSAQNGYYHQMVSSVARHFGVSVNTPVRHLPEAVMDTLLHGSKGELLRIRYQGRSGNSRDYHTTFEGVIPNLERRYRESESDYIRMEIERYMASRPCPTCQGKRLKPEILAVLLNGRSIVDVTSLPVGKASLWFAGLEKQLNQREMLIATQILKEIRARLGFLIDVGLDYVTLDRPSGTLSGGEAQRIRLATQIGSSLMPGIGLHQRDNGRLLDTVRRLRDLGNTVLVVEHDEETIRAADYIVDIGPGAGERGGHVVVAGPLPAMLAAPDSVTGQFLRGERSVSVPASRRTGNGHSLVVRGAYANNLKHIDVKFPLGTMICVSGVSGSGKSTLVNEILYRHLAHSFYRSRDLPGAHDHIEGIEALDKVVNVDQSPIGRTPRSNPATYTGLFTPIRQLFATMPEARIRGYTPGRFSFNVKGGRCEACQGEGIIQIEMQFLPDVYVPCEVCKGRRYNREALEITFKNKSIADVLEMTVDQAVEFFDALPRIRQKLITLADVGLGYIRLGQPATTLSGGEAQRVKLATELSKRGTGKTLYVLDEPTTGLHFADVERLLQVLQRLVEQGNTVVVIEHNLDVIKQCDYVIDLGPEGGDAGGYVVATGTPEEIAANEHSYTGQFLKRALPERQGTTVGG